MWKHKTQIIILIIFALGILLLVPLFINANTVARQNVNYKAQDVNLVLSETSKHDLNFSNDIITSFSITGMLKGTGDAKVYLQSSDGQKLLVYSSSHSQKPSGITGFSFAANSDNLENTFRNACLETCYFVKSNGPYSLYAELDPNTSIIISRIIYE